MCAHLDISTFQGVRILMFHPCSHVSSCFSHCLAQPDQDFILMILGLACTKTGPKIVPISTVQLVRIRVVSRGLTHSDQNYLLIIFGMD